ncbi:MAG: biotin/lipoyl-binding protein [Chloroflexota bacterium]
MKVRQILIVIFMSLVLVSLVACNPLASSGTGGTARQVDVVRGDLTVKVSGSGDISIFHEANLTFGAGGRVEHIYVEEGDAVSQGKELARLDTRPLELALAQAKVAHTQAQSSVSQATVAVRMAQYDLDQALGHYTWPDIKAAQDDVDAAEAYYDYVTENAPLAIGYAQTRLILARAKLDALIHVYDTEEVAIKRLQVDSANQSLALAQQSVEVAQKAVNEAQRQLDESVITAPLRWCYRQY